MLIRDGSVAKDDFTKLADAAPLGRGAVIVSLKRFLAEREALLERDDPLGLLLETSDSPEELGSDVEKLALVVLDIPHFKDGRGFTLARILRARLGFKGEIRVAGHVLHNQITFYKRVGVNAFELAENLSLEDYNAALGEITNVYQPSVDGRKTIYNMRSGQG
jgi:uncharacterized protein (DUF934 family)